MKHIIEKLEEIQVENSDYHDNIQEMLDEYTKLIDLKLRELKSITNREIKLAIIDDTILHVWKEADELSLEDVNKLIQQIKEVLLQ